MLGQYATDGELEELFYSYEGGVMDRENKRFILPGEFVNPDGPTSLHWDELAEVYEGNRARTKIIKGGFHGLMQGLLDELVQEGSMSCDSLHAGDYFFINVGGITIDVPLEKAGPYGKQWEPITYYPRILADAEAYVNNFHGDALYPVYVTQVVSVPNKPWEI